MLPRGAYFLEAIRSVFFAVSVAFSINFSLWSVVWARSRVAFFPALVVSWFCVRQFVLLYFVVFRGMCFYISMFLSHMRVCD